jgi:nitrogen fixation protein
MRNAVFKVRIGIFGAGFRLRAPEIPSDIRLPGALSMI